MQSWFKKKVDLTQLEKVRQSLLTDFLDSISQAPQYERTPLDSLSYSAILEGLSLLAKYEPHPQIGNYFLMAKIALNDDRNLSLISDFSETFRQDIKRMSTTPNWIPRMLAERIDQLVFHRMEPWEQGKPGTDYNIADTLSLAFAIAYVEKVNEIPNKFRL